MSLLALLRASVAAARVGVRVLGDGSNDAAVLGTEPRGRGRRKAASRIDPLCVKELIMRRRGVRFNPRPAGPPLIVTTNTHSNITRITNATVTRDNNILLRIHGPTRS